jgi:hypothetical protein
MQAWKITNAESIHIIEMHNRRNFASRANGDNAGGKFWRQGYSDLRR